MRVPLLLGGYFAVAHDSHVRGKFKKRNDGCEFLRLDADARLALCNALVLDHAVAAPSSAWLQPSQRTFGSAKQCGAAMVGENFGSASGRLPRIIAVKGSDLPGLFRKRVVGRAGSVSEEAALQRAPNARAARVGGARAEEVTLSSSFVRERIRQDGPGRALVALEAGGVLAPRVAALLQELLSTDVQTTGPQK
eukprot:TRINITY_DN12611_c0_g1_i2.p1 TRINITY_DN12611_c0_g1~~TRINITY_DN12611_c0_g1_i2.p1  ORF type:complete len:194 (+),score=23.38 TRINITY_DN12611_c0_g1_i2:260-841(+)